MKNALLVTSLFLSASFASAQITLEKSYQGIGLVTIHNVENEGYKYAVTNTGTNKVELHNADHSLWKTFNLNIPANFALNGGVQYVSSKLFDNDNGVEVVITYSEVGANPPNYITQIINDDGSVLQTFSNAYFMSVHKVDNAWKAVVTKYPGPFHSDVYALPGQLLFVSSPGGGNNADAALYPNPMQTSAVLAYTLPSGTHAGQLQVYNTSGALVRSYNVTSEFESIVIYRNDLPAGSYLYSLVVPGLSIVTKPFVIQ